MENLGVDGRILKCIIKKYDGSVWNGDERLLLKSHARNGFT